jgi:hypothetical protein
MVHVFGVRFANKQQNRNTVHASAMSADSVVVDEEDDDDNNNNDDVKKV